MKEIEIRNNKVLLINRRHPDYQEIDITPAYQFFKEFFQWKLNKRADSKD